MVRLTLARKIAAITLTLWKKGEDFDINKLNSQSRLSVSERALSISGDFSSGSGGSVLETLEVESEHPNIP
jgi:hypothetical protein